MNDSIPLVGGYSVYIITFSTDGDSLHLRRNNAVLAQTSNLVSSGDSTIRLEHDGAGNLEVWQDSVSRLTHTDGSPLTGLSVGIFSQQTEHDNWSAGDL